MTAGDAQLQTQRPKGLPTWLLMVAPLLLLGVVIWGIVALRPVERLRGEGFPPVEELSVMRTVLPMPGLIELHVLNSGPDPVTVAQVMVDEAYWSHWMDAGHGVTNDPALDALPPEDRVAEIERRRTIAPLGKARITLDYAWVEGETHEITLISRNGVTFSTEIAVAVQSPTPDAAQFGLFALLGLLVGVLPVSIGLLWYPLVRRIGQRTLGAILCFTVGLLAFLVVDALTEAIEAAHELPGVYEGTALIVAGFAASVLVLAAIGSWFEPSSDKSGGASGMTLAYLIAGGIGLHNLSEGLSIGAAFNLGEISLGATLIIGFTVHNLTEGLAIVAPLSKVRVRLRQFLWLGLLAGAPTILGGWIGAFAYSRVLAVLFLAIGAGAIVQVAYAILKRMAEGTGWSRMLTLPPNLGGLAAGYLAMYVTGLFVGV